MLLKNRYIIPNRHILSNSAHSFKYAHIPSRSRPDFQLLGLKQACALRTLGSQPLSYTGKPKVSPTPFLVQVRTTSKQKRRHRVAVFVCGAAGRT
jgi:hypothetical protein